MDKEDIIVIRLEHTVSESVSEYYRKQFPNREVWIFGSNVRSVHVLKEGYYNYIYEVFDLDKATEVIRLNDQSQPAVEKQISMEEFLGNGKTSNSW